MSLDTRIPLNIKPHKLYHFLIKYSLHNLLIIDYNLFPTKILLKGENEPNHLYFF